MIRYLLDELYTYEEDHSNALCPNPPPKLLGTSPELELLEGFRSDVNTQVTRMQTEIQHCHTLVHQVINLNAPSNAGSFMLNPISSIPISQFNALPTPLESFTASSYYPASSNAEIVCFCFFRNLKVDTESSNSRAMDLEN